MTIDMVVNLRGGLADSAWTHKAGKVSNKTEKLLEVTKHSLDLGIEQAVDGNRIGDIGHAIQSYAEKEGYSVVRNFSGHGIGRTIHEDPQIPHFGEAGKGQRLKKGMAVTIEPMINEGSWHSRMDSNGWTARTRDGKKSAQYEHTIIITENEPIILTRQS